MNRGTKLIVLLTAFACSTGAAPQPAPPPDVQIPPKEEDQIFDHNTKKILGNVQQIRSVRPNQIAYTDKNGKLQFANRPPCEVQRWDGYTNAEEILAACEARLRQLSRAADAIVLAGDKDGAAEGLERGRAEVEAALSRIREGAPNNAHQRAQAGHSRLAAFARADVKVRRDVWLEVQRHTEPLLRALLDERFREVPALCTAQDTELGTIVRARERTIFAVAARTVVDRFKGARAGLQQAAGRLQPLPSTACPDNLADLDSLLQGVKEQQGVLQTLSDTEWLGSGIHSWLEKRRRDTNEWAGKLQRVSELTTGARQGDQTLVALRKKFAREPNLDLQAASEHYRNLDKSLADEEKRLLKEPADDHRAFALAHLSRIREQAQGDHRDLKIPARERELQQRLAAIGTIREPPQAKQLRLDLEQQIRALGALLQEESRAGGQARLQTLISQGRDGQLQCLRQEAESFVRKIREDAEGAVRNLNDAQLGQAERSFQTWTAELDTWRKGWQRDLAEARQEGAVTATVANVEAVRKILEVGSAVVAVRNVLAVVPAKVDEPEQYDEWDSRLASLSRQLQDIPDLQGVSPTVAEAVRQTGETLDSKRKTLRAQGLAIQFRREERRLNQHLAAAEAALSAGQLLRTRRVLQSARDSVGQLEKAVPREASPTDVQSFLARVEQARTRHRESAQRLEHAIGERRKAAGWRPLPLPGSPLIEPGPQESVLRLEMLLAQDRLPEMQAGLEQFRAAYPDPPWPARAAELQMRLDYQSAVAQEEAGELGAARQAYEQLAERRDQPLARAAESAARRVKSRQDAQRRHRQATFRAGTIGVLLLAATVGLLAVGWRNAPRQRLRRARQRLTAAQAAAARGDWNQRDRYLRGVAEILTRFPEGHAEAAQLRQQISPRAVAQGTTSSPRPVAVDGLATPLVLEHVLASSSGLEAVPFCLQWLRRHTVREESQAGCDAALAWLAERLKPDPQMLPPELALRAQYAGQLWQLQPHLSWPGCYAVCARWWQGDHAEARLLAERLADARETLEAPDAFRLILAHCWWQAGQARAAIELLDQLRRSPEVGRQAEGWLQIIQASRAQAKSGRRPGIGARLAATLLR